MKKMDSVFTPEGEISTYVFEGALNESELANILEDRGRPEWLRLVSESHEPNLVTNVGRQQMTKLIVLETTAAVGYIAVSTSVIAPALADTVLPSELSRKAVSIRASISTFYQRYAAYWGPTDFNSTAILSAGLNDTASTGGNMFADASITLSKTNTQSATVEWRVQATT